MLIAGTVDLPAPGMSREYLVILRWTNRFWSQEQIATLRLNRETVERLIRRPEMIRARLVWSVEGIHDQRLGDLPALTSEAEQVQMWRQSLSLPPEE